MKTHSGGRASSLQLECYGARLRVLAEPRILDRLPPLLPPDSKIISNPDSDATFAIEANGKPRAYALKASYQRGQSIFGTLEEAASEFHLGVAMFARPYLFVHAGVTVWRGGAILLPGRSMTGKSTLVAALVEQGAKYFSDEYAVFDENGCVHAYRKPISLRGPEKGVGKIVTMAQGGKRGAKATAPRLMAFLKFKEGARWAPKMLTPAEAVLEIFKNTVAARTRADFALPLFGRVAQEAVAIRGWRPEASETARALTEMTSKKRA